MAFERGETLSEVLEPAVADALRADDQSLDDLPIGVLVFLDGEVVRVNDGWRSLTGLTLAESRGTKWLAAVHPDDRAHAEAVPRLAIGGTDAAGDWRVLRPVRSNPLRPDSQGTAESRTHPDREPDQMDEVWVHARVRHAKTVNVRTCVVTLTEIATHKANEMRLLHLATHDPLTGLPNRDAFVARVEVALARACARPRDGPAVRRPRPVQAGERSIRPPRRRSPTDCGGAADARTLRPFDTLGRLGGDELGIVCDVASAHDATRLADRIVDVVSEPFPIDDQIVTIGASVGVATAAPGASLTSEQLIAGADEAMYRAKRAGGGQWWMRGAPETAVSLPPHDRGGSRRAGQAGSRDHGVAAARIDIRLLTDGAEDERLVERIATIIEALERASGLAARTSTTDGSLLGRNAASRARRGVAGAVSGATPVRWSSCRSAPLPHGPPTSGAARCRPHAPRSRARAGVGRHPLRIRRDL
jgi:GGDEF domain-containing protein